MSTILGEVQSGVFWTLGIEIQFYVVAPLLVMPMLMASEKSLQTRLIVSYIFYFGMVV